MSADRVATRRRALTGAWIETCRAQSSRERHRVAPLRARGLKRQLGRRDRGYVDGRALTGAWIETSCMAVNWRLPDVAPLRARGLKQRGTTDWYRHGGRALTGAWIETNSATFASSSACRRALTGAWIETRAKHRGQAWNAVAPLRARGLKRRRHARESNGVLSRPYGRVD